MLQYSLFYSQESKERNGWRDDAKRRKTRAMSIQLSTVAIGDVRKSKIERLNKDSEKWLEENKERKRKQQFLRQQSSLVPAAGLSEPIIGVMPDPYENEI